MNPWEILNLQPNSSLKEIKKAYATLLKTNHPEENPEGYQKLRKAYDLAVKLSKSNTNKTTNNILADTENLDNEFESSSSIDAEITFNSKENTHNSNHKFFNDGSDFSTEQNTNSSSYKVFNDGSTFNNEQTNQNSNYKVFNNNSNFSNGSRTKNTSYKVFDSYSNNYYDEKDEYDKFFLKLDKVYTNLELRLKKESWEELLNNPILWNLDFTETLFADFLSYLSTHYYIPKNIWNIIDKTLSYTEKLNGYKLDDLQYNILSKFIENINNMSNISFDYLENIDPLSFDRYLSYKYNAFHNLNIKFYGKAKEYLDLANEIYKDDPELMKLQGEYFFELRNYKEAQTLFTKAININNNDYKSMYRIGQIYCYYKEYSKAIPYLCKVPQSGEFILVTVILANCYYYTNEFKNADDYYKKFMKSVPNHLYLKKYAKNLKINRILHSKIKIKDKFDYINPLKFLDNTYTKKRTVKKIKINWLTVLIIIGVIARFAKVYVKYEASNTNLNNTFIEQQREITEANIENNELMNNINKDDEEFNKLSEDYKNAPVDSNIKLKITNLASNVIYMATDDSGKQVYLSESEFNSSIYKDNELKYNVNRFYFSKVDSNNVIIINSDDFLELSITDNISIYIECTIKNLSPELLTKMQNEVKSAYPNENVTLITNRYFQNINYFWGH